MEVLIMSATIWQYILAMICCTIVLFLLHEFFRKFLKITSLLFFIALFSFPLWTYNSKDWFLIAKTLLMIVSIIIINSSRLSYSLKGIHLSIFNGNITFWLIYLALISNILLALSPDFEIGNYYNAVAGFMLCITVPLPPKGWRIDNTRYKNHDLFVDLSIIWCLLYISWWMNFIYGSWPGIFSRGICLMLVTLIPVIIYKSNDLWLSIRAYTLVFYLLSIAFFNYKIPYLDISVKMTRNLLIFWGILNSIIALAYSTYWFTDGRKKYKEKYSEIVTTI
jgi:hypothetical protein